MILARKDSVGLVRLWLKVSTPKFTELKTGPIDLSMAMAEGWHNLPALYGRKVRKVRPIDGFATGVVEGGKVTITAFSSGILIRSNSDSGSTMLSLDLSWIRTTVPERMVIEVSSKGLE
jgi:hypothetical protein